tara:strand:- start:63 stop:1793 length:1731 start_codon:yes stop_codon:yes gene_type:complete
MRERVRAAFESGDISPLIREAILEAQQASESPSLSEEIVAAHNCGEINLFEVEPSSADRQGGQVDFWSWQHFLSKVLVELECAPAQVLERVQSMTAEGGNDLASGSLCKPFRDWMYKNKQASAVVALLDDASKDDVVMRSVCIEARALSEPRDAVAEIVRLLNDTEEAANLAAALAAGNIDLSLHDDLVEEVCTSLVEKVQGNPIDLVTANLLDALIRIYVRSPRLIEGPLLEVLTFPEFDPGPDAIHRLAHRLFLNADELSPPLVKAIVEVTIRLPEENLGTLSVLDDAVANLLRVGRREEAIELFNRLVFERGFTADQLEDSSRAILSLSKQELSAFAVDCLLSGSVALGDALSDILMGYHGQEPFELELPADAQTLPPRESHFLARKAVGFLFLRPVTAASLLIEIAENDPENLNEPISELLFDPLLLNYSGILREWFEVQAVSDRPSAELLNKILNDLDRYLEGLREAGEVAELHPSERQRMIERRMQQRKMEVAREKADKASILELIATRQVMLYGRKAISYFDDVEGVSRRNVMELSTFSTSVETPRHDILEPFGLDLMLRTLRVEKLTP